jgi:hypothetical protein
MFTKCNTVTDSVTADHQTLKYRIPDFKIFLKLFIFLLDISRRIGTLMSGKEENSPAVLR